MLSVEAILNVLTHINLVYNLISVLLEGRGENHYLIILGHSLDELHAARSNQEETVISVLNVVDQGLI